MTKIIIIKFSDEMKMKRFIIINENVRIQNYLDENSVTKSQSNFSMKHPKSRNGIDSKVLTLM